MTTGKKISISGDLGSGKSVTSKYIAEKLGYKYFSTGEIQRQMAQERGISVLEMNKVADINAEIDKKIDETLVSISRSDENYILDSRLAWYFVPLSLKVYLRTNIEVTVKRIMSDKKRKSESYSSREKARFEILERKASENARFLLAYGADCGDMSNYDTIIETTSVLPGEIGDFIIKLSTAGVAGNSTAYWVSPKFMFPTRKFDATDARQALGTYPEVEAGAKIVCLLHEGYYFILEGHKRVSAALQNGVSLLPVQLVEAGSPLHVGMIPEDFPISGFTGTHTDAWEKCHGFLFEIYPHFDPVVKR